MKITSPRFKEKMAFAVNQSVFAVVGQYHDGTWGLMDFWDLPFTARFYSDACRMKRDIEKKAKGKPWENRMRIIKITL
jgi:hypothetical protein